MGLHDHLHRRHAARNPQPEPLNERAIQTLVSVVYITATPTFDGPIGGYSTVGQTATSDKQSTTAQQKATTATSKQTQAKSSQAVASSAAASSNDAASSVAANSDSTVESSSTDVPTAISSPTMSLTSSGILVASTPLAATASSQVAAVASASSSSQASSSSSGGMSAGGKAGLAIGILLLFAAVLSLVLFCFRKRKNQQKQALADQEKNNPFSDARRASIQTTRTAPVAPRLSLRPVTQFLPNLGEKRQSRGNLLGAAAPMSEKSQPVESGAQANNRSNPFGNHAETIDAANANGPAEVQIMSASGEVVSAATGAAAGPVRRASKLDKGDKPMDFTRSNPFMGPPSPTPTDFSATSDNNAFPQQTATGAAIAAAGGPANSTVHRVQLDFKPSMDDELELRAGQLIRMLHEYDDGWALCIRLDRSQQGVVPRTCLSTRPVKPRPQAPQAQGPATARGPQPGMRGPPQGRPRAASNPQGPQGRPMTPTNGQSRPMTPNGQGRPMTPNGQGRPMSPAMINGPPRSMSPGPQGSPRGPGPQGRPRSPSASQVQGRRNSPPGMSPMNPAMGSSPPGPQGPLSRKPVPGQAM